MASSKRSLGTRVQASPADMGGGVTLTSAQPGGTAVRRGAGAGTQQSKSPLAKDTPGGAKVVGVKGRTVVGTGKTIPSS